MYTYVLTHTLTHTFMHTHTHTYTHTAAAQMRHTLEGLHMPTSIGITTGDVYCGTIGSHMRMEYTAIGNGKHSH
jgi:class 3 adenylate cyclase